MTTIELFNELSDLFNEISEEEFMRRFTNDDFQRSSKDGKCDMYRNGIHGLGFVFEIDGKLVCLGN